MGKTNRQWSPGRTVFSFRVDHDTPVDDVPRDVVDRAAGQIGMGPCVEAYRTGKPVSVDKIADVHDRWPVFERAAMAQGFRSMHAFPMRLRGQTIGAMNLFSYAEGDLDSDDIAIAQALTDVATIGVLQQRTIEEHKNVTQQLQQALDSRVVVEQAEGVIAAQQGVDMSRAFTILRTYARSHQTKLGDVARRVVDRTLVLPQGAPPTDSP
ncbi:GAF and ANTAR domain-containing protein [Microbacterium sp. 1P10UB]|uniref:GAF and ANTAR domain-containing protein n=1 Tax=unclassified Microbacterium TaxID=2609290 RepID=UPI0039A2132B